MSTYKISDLYPTDKKRREELTEFNTKYKEETIVKLKDLLKGKDRDLEVFEKYNARYGSVEGDVGTESFSNVETLIRTVGLKQIEEDEKEIASLRESSAKKFAELEAEGKKTRYQMILGLKQLTSDEMKNVKVARNNLQLVQEQGTEKWYLLVASKVIDVSDEKSQQEIEKLPNLEYLKLENVRRELEKAQMELDSEKKKQHSRLAEVQGLLGKAQPGKDLQKLKDEQKKLEKDLQDHLSDKISKTFKLQEAVKKTVQKPVTEGEERAKIKAGVYSTLYGSLLLIRLIILREQSLNRLEQLGEKQPLPNLRAIVPLLREKALVKLSSFTEPQLKVFEQDQTIKALLQKRETLLSKQKPDVNDVAQITNEIEAHIDKFDDLAIVIDVIKELEKKDKIDPKQIENIENGLRGTLVSFGSDYLAIPENRDRLVKSLSKSLSANKSIGSVFGQAFAISPEAVKNIATKLTNKHAAEVQQQQPKFPMTLASVQNELDRISQLISKRNHEGAKGLYKELFELEDKLKGKDKKNKIDALQVTYGGELRGLSAVIEILKAETLAKSKNIPEMSSEVIPEPTLDFTEEELKAFAEESAKRVEIAKREEKERSEKYMQEREAQHVLDQEQRKQQTPKQTILEKLKEHNKPRQIEPLVREKGSVLQAREEEKAEKRAKENPPLEGAAYVSNEIVNDAIKSAKGKQIDSHKLKEKLESFGFDYLVAHRKQLLDQVSSALTANKTVGTIISGLEKNYQAKVKQDKQEREQEVKKQIGALGQPIGNIQNLINDIEKNLDKKSATAEVLLNGLVMALNGKATNVIPVTYQNKPMVLSDVMEILKKESIQQIAQRKTVEPVLTTVKKEEIKQEEKKDNKINPSIELPPVVEKEEESIEQEEIIKRPRKIAEMRVSTKEEKIAFARLAAEITLDTGKRADDIIGKAMEKSGLKKDQEKTRQALFTVQQALVSFGADYLDVNSAHLANTLSQSLTANKTLATGLGLKSFTIAPTEVKKIAAGLVQIHSEKQKQQSTVDFNKIIEDMADAIKEGSENGLKKAALSLSLLKPYFEDKKKIDAIQVQYGGSTVGLFTAIQTLKAEYDKKVPSQTQIATDVLTKPKNETFGAVDITEGNVDLNHPPEFDPLPELDKRGKIIEKKVVKQAQETIPEVKTQSKVDADFEKIHTDMNNEVSMGDLDLNFEFGIKPKSMEPKVEQKPEDEFSDPFFTENVEQGLDSKVTELSDEDRLAFKEFDLKEKDKVDDADFVSGEVNDKKTLPTVDVKPVKKEAEKVTISKLDKDLLSLKNLIVNILSKFIPPLKKDALIDPEFKTKILDAFKQVRISSPTKIVDTVKNVSNVVTDVKAEVPQKLQEITAKVDGKRVSLVQLPETLNEKLESKGQKLTDVIADLKEKRQEMSQKPLPPIPEKKGTVKMQQVGSIEKKPLPAPPLSSKMQEKKLQETTQEIKVNKEVKDQSKAVSRRH